MPYKNLFDCLVKEVRNNGLKGLFVGCLPWVIRIAPHGFIVLIVSE